MDPVRVDTASPPRTVELSFQSSGARLNGFLYLANGPYAHATVILLHGLPGNERNLDLAQALRRAGMNVLFFSYRGAWGSGGTFSFANALEDVGAASRFVRSDSSVKAFGVDPRRVILVGHSMGGWLALMGAAADTAVRCAVALDFWNPGATGAELRTDASADTAFTRYADWLTAPGAPLHADSGRPLTREIEDHAEQWSPENSAGALRTRPLLILSTRANESHPRLIAALRAAGAQHVTAQQWKTDHGFSAERIKLARTIVGWLGRNCGT